MDRFDWDNIKKEVEESEPNRDDYGNLIKSAYLGSCFNIMPSGKYYTPWANSNVTEEEAKQDEEFLEQLEAEANKHGLFIFAGEGDPTDMFAGMIVED